MCSRLPKILTVLGLFLYALSSTAQDDEVCGMSEDKKAVKAYEKAMDKKNSYGERMNYFREAIDIDPDFTLAIWNKTFAQIKTARSNHKPYQKTESSLRQVVEDCPEIHSAPYFFLAEINMGNANYADAAFFYDKFLHFRSDEDAKFERRYDDQVMVAKINFKQAEFLEYQYANPHPFNPKKVIPLSQDNSDEYLPSISPDNDVMLFTRRIELEDNSKASYVKNDAVVKIERFSASNFMDGEYGKGQAFGKPFNTNPKANYGGATISTDNKEIYFTICEPVQGKMNCDLYTSRYEISNLDATGTRSGFWSKPRNMGPGINSEDGWEAQPTISKDGKWLMYAVKREGTRGIDIFQSHRDEDGTWSEGKSMGEPINTSGDEKSPFFHSDNKTLYFASKNGHLGMGGYDVFLSKFVDGQWTEPKNIGYPLNTEQDEHGYIVSLDGKNGFFGSASVQNQRTKSINLYTLELPEEVRPDRVLMVKGVVKTVNDKVPTSAVIELRNTKTQEVETVKVDSNDGTFTAIVNVEDTADYMLTAKGKDLAFNNKLIKSPKKDEPVKKKVRVEVQKSKVGQHITIENIHFATNSSNLTADSRASLDALIAYMNEHPSFKISVEGHTDNVGDPKANLALSTDRAYSVMAYMQENGVVGSSLKFKGWGATKPLMSNKSAAGRALNRRIEIVVLTK